jgi:uncharacterized SAM-binding protein YcdF (DUF218 family)
MLMFKVIQFFLLPSVFILVFLLIGLFLFFKKRKVGITFILIGTFCYFLFSSAFANILISPLENYYGEISEEDIENIDSLVLLMGGARGEDFPSNSQLSESTLARVAGAIQIYFKKEGDLKIIISGSHPLSLIESTGSLTSDFLASLGIPREDILLEEESKNTYQASIELQKVLGEERFALLTSASHMPRAVYIFKKSGLNPIPAPADFQEEKVFGILGLFPDPKNLRKSDLAFHEYFGLVYYKFRY